MNNIKFPITLEYNCLSFPPKEIDIKQVYSLDKKDEKYFLISNKEKREVELSYVKYFFIPINGDWKGIY